MTKYGSELEKTEKQLANTDSVEDHLSVDEWLKIRKEAALRIDPETAEVEWTYALTLDPYGVYPDLPEEARQVHATLTEWSPAVFIGFNSISFDEPLLRQAFYQTLQPIYLTNT